MADPSLPDFVSVADSGSHFEVNGAPFFFAGCNSYMLMASLELPHRWLIARINPNKSVRGYFLHRTATNIAQKAGSIS